MKTSSLKQQLRQMHELAFQMPDGTQVPAHFHLTEIGLVTKRFIDCGGKLRNDAVASLQLWVANDTDHRLTPGKFLDIIQLAEERLGLGDLEIEVEYQTDTIGKFGLELVNGKLHLTNKNTDCLAKENCRTTEAKISEQSCCTPTSGCCN